MTAKRSNIKASPATRCNVVSIFLFVCTFLSSNLHAQLDKFFESQNLEAASAYVIRNETTILKQHWGSASDTTVYSIGSLSKMFVAAEAYSLVLHGDLHWDDRPEVNPNVTLRQLLEHTAGFDDMRFRNYLAKGRDWRKWASHRQAEFRCRWKPGTRQSYSNAGYALAAKMIDDANQKAEWRCMIGSSFVGMFLRNVEFEDDYLLKPALGMKCSAEDLEQILWTLSRSKGNEDSLILSWTECSTLPKNQQNLVGTFGAGLRREEIAGRFFFGASGYIPGFRSRFLWHPSSNTYILILLKGSGGNIRMWEKEIVKSLPMDTIPVEQADGPFADPTGYYQFSNPRNSILWPIEFLLGSVRVEWQAGKGTIDEFMGRSISFLPAGGDGLFREDGKRYASILIEESKGGRLIMRDGQRYFEQTNLMTVILKRGFVIWSLLTILITLFGFFWRWIQHRNWRSSRGMKLRGLLAGNSLLIILAVVLLWNSDPFILGHLNLKTGLVFLLSLIFPAVALVGIHQYMEQSRRGWNGIQAKLNLIMLLNQLCISLFCGYFGWIGVKTWTF